MNRTTLNPLTKIAFISALITILVLPPAVYISSLVSLSWMKTVLETLAIIAFGISLINIPISIISMFSKEHLFKRCFSLVVNFSPLALVIIGLAIEFMNEFNSTPA